MEVQTFRARSMQEALQLVRRTLGPDAAVLQAKEVGRGSMSWLTGAREIEVLALSGVNLPSRFTERDAGELDEGPSHTLHAHVSENGVGDGAGWDSEQLLDYRTKFRADLRCEDTFQQSLVEQLSATSRTLEGHDLPAPLAMLYRQMRESDISAEIARDLMARIDGSATDLHLSDPAQLFSHAERLLAREIQVCGTIQIASAQPHVVAMIGPTGVGKTTTIAKLAAEFRLKKHRRVGLITVDTYRIAAVEQLRTYAEIIELPLEIVSTPREMRLAVDRLSSLDLVLIDTAGRSPRDEVRIQELKSLLGEAQADEVHLVLSAAAGTASLIQAAQRFRPVGVTALVLTKLDEAAGIGGLLSLLRDSRLPLSYLTDGQSVPDDIQAADSNALARMMLGLDTIHSDTIHSEA